MAPAHEGRRCAQCATIVTDFTSMNDGELAAYFRTHEVHCGRFRIDQVQRNIVPQPQPGLLPRLYTRAIAVLLGLYAIIPRAFAQKSVPATIQSTNTDTQSTNLLVHGCVWDNTLNVALQDAVVTIADTNLSTTTTTDGSFWFYLPAAWSGRSITLNATEFITTKEHSAEYVMEPVSITLSQATALREIVIYKTSAADSVNLGVPLSQITLKTYNLTGLVSPRDVETKKEKRSGPFGFLRRKKKG